MVGILNNLRSLHNVGSIFRTADGAGLKKLYLCGLTPAPVDELGRWRPQLVKVALGAEKTVAWEKIAKAVLLARRLRKAGFLIIALETGLKAEPYYRLRIKKRSAKIALVVGHERKGIAPALLRECDKIIKIPLFGRKESLNVAVAFGIAAFYLAHQLRS